MIRHVALARWFVLDLLSFPFAAASPDGIVSASHSAVAAAGARLLAAGGNAVDAAAAVQFALNVVEPQSSGIGGGFMMIYLAKTGQRVIVDSREHAAAAASADQFAPDGAPMPFPLASTSGVSVGVPGTLCGIDAALTRWGTKPLADTLAPAIDLAEHGFRVNRFLAEDIANDQGRTRHDPQTAAIFRPDGVPLAEDDWLVQRDRART